MKPTRRAVAEYRNGKPVRWVFIVDPARVLALRRRISKNPNSQVNRALRELGLVKEKR